LTDGLWPDLKITFDQNHIFKEFQKKKLCLAVGIYRTISNKSVISILTLIGTTKRISL
jgi:hypothetical protein